MPAKDSIFLSTLSLRRATCQRLGQIAVIRISIHALLAESDQAGNIVDTTVRISIHALLAESDTRTQSQSLFAYISIHALLAESDCYSFRHSASCWHFYPRSPCGERLGQIACGEPITAISIHALLAESDVQVQRANSHHTDFYPRSPCGERRPVGFQHSHIAGFLSTLSLRRATCGPRTPA